VRYNFKPKDNDWHVGSNSGLTVKAVLYILFFITMIAWSFESSARDHELMELHIVKNDGMRTHEVYKCLNTKLCYEMYKVLRYRDRSLNCSQRMWIVRDNGINVNLKGDRR
jgi:hypothetical protein